MQVYSDELYHHGVKGMKWGVRNEYKPTGHRPSKNQNDKTKVTSKLERYAYDIGVRFAHREIKKLKYYAMQLKQKKKKMEY